MFSLYFIRVSQALYHRFPNGEVAKPLVGPDPPEPPEKMHPSGIPTSPESLQVGPESLTVCPGGRGAIKVL